jgi:NAD(P)-dependent dehydrogenase (short-subunit alcohol dehydrogenase family)
MLTGKVALVTGASHRVGKAIALACAAAGADIAVHYRSARDGALATVDAAIEIGRRAQSFQADVTDAGEARRLIDEVVATFGGVDVLVNSAAVFIHHSFTAGDDAEWERAWRTSFETNLLAPARLARLAAPSLRQREGVIVNIVEVGATHAWPGYAHHTAAKAGLAHLTRTLAVALGPQIRVVGVSPGIAQFPDEMPDDERRALIAKTALERAGTPEDVAEAVVFLAGQGYTTGAILNVDGGWSVPR